MQPILQANGIGPKGQLVTHPLELCAISSLCVQIVTEKGKKKGSSSGAQNSPTTGRFLVRIFIFAWGPRGLPGPEFRLPWAAGVRWDGPAGGGTWGVRPAERRLPNGPAADVSCPWVPGGQNFPGRYPVRFVPLWAGPRRPRLARGQSAQVPFFFSIYEEDHEIAD